MCGRKEGEQMNHLLSFLPPRREKVHYAIKEPRHGATCVCLWRWGMREVGECGGGG